MESELFVNGTLMRGLPLHDNLAGATYLGTFRTAPIYRLFSIGDIHPGMYPVETGGVAVEGELYRVPEATLRRVLAGEPPNLYLGAVRLEDGRETPGILYERSALTPEARDISAYGGWRAYMAREAGQATE